MDVDIFASVIGPNEGAVVGATLRQLTLYSHLIPNFFKLFFIFGLLAVVLYLNLDFL